MKLTITRLRSGTNYKTPLHDIMDSFYELYKEYMSLRLTSGFKEEANLIQEWLVAKIAQA